MRFYYSASDEILLDYLGTKSLPTTTDVTNDLVSSMQESLQRTRTNDQCDKFTLQEIMRQSS